MRIQHLNELSYSLPIFHSPSKKYISAHDSGYLNVYAVSSEGISETKLLDWSKEFPDFFVLGSSWVKDKIVASVVHLPHGKNLTDQNFFKAIRAKGETILLDPVTKKYSRILDEAFRSLSCPPDGSVITCSIKSTSPEKDDFLIYSLSGSNSTAKLLHQKTNFFPRSITWADNGSFYCTIINDKRADSLQQVFVSSLKIIDLTLPQGYYVSSFYLSENNLDVGCINRSENFSIFALDPLSHDIKDKISISPSLKSKNDKHYLLCRHKDNFIIINPDRPEGYINILFYSSKTNSPVDAFRMPGYFSSIYHLDEDNLLFRSVEDDDSRHCYLVSQLKSETIPTDIINKYPKNILSMRPYTSR